jgi:hypothetical protein
MSRQWSCLIVNLAKSLNSTISGPLLNLNITPQSLKGETTTLTIPPPIITG